MSRLKNKKKKNDAIAKVFGPEHRGRVKALGRGDTSKKFVAQSIGKENTS